MKKIDEDDVKEDTFRRETCWLNTKVGGQVNEE